MGIGVTRVKQSAFGKLPTGHWTLLLIPLGQPLVCVSVSDGSLPLAKAGKPPLLTKHHIQHWAALCQGPQCLRDEDPTTRTTTTTMTTTELLPPLAGAPAASSALISKQRCSSTLLKPFKKCLLLHCALFSTHIWPRERSSAHWLPSAPFYSTLSRPVLFFRHHSTGSRSWSHPSRRCRPWSRRCRR